MDTFLKIPKEQFSSILSDRIETGLELVDVQVRNDNDLKFLSDSFEFWNDYNLEYLKSAFNNENNEYRQTYDNTAFLNGLYSRAGKDIIIKNKIRAKVVSLQKLYGKVELLKDSENLKISVEDYNKKEVKLSSDIFIVHGHDDVVRLNVTRAIEQLGLNPIILNEKANEGKTVIEKFEAHSNVSYAIILMTNDDKGNVKSASELNPRARQNVIFEFGFFCGKLGRKGVCVLYERGVELPSDINGFVYIPIDSAGGWKLKVVNELKAIGYNIDTNLLK